MFLKFMEEQNENGAFGERRTPSESRKTNFRQERHEIMSNLTRWEHKWNPFKEMEEMQDRLSTLLHRTFGRVPLHGNGEEEPLATTEWSPLVDIMEDDKEYAIKVELPEVHKEDLKVVMENGVLTISGERKFEKEVKEKKYHRIERAYGSFMRSFSVPDDANASKVNAEFKDGILWVHVAKDEKARPKTIDVKIA